MLENKFTWLHFIQLIHYNEGPPPVPPSVHHTNINLGYTT